MKKIAVASTVVGLFFLMSCKLENESIKAIDGKINVSMLEILGEKDPNFQIRFSTNTVYGCSNYVILMASEFDEDTKTLDVTLNDVYADNFCLGGSAPAINAYNFGKIENGTYQVKVRVKNGETLSGQFVVSDSDYTLDMASNAQFEIENSHLFKMPAGIVWGTVTKNSNTEATDALAEDFYELLAENGLADTLLAVGDYTYFKVSDTGKVSKRRSTTAPAGTTDFAMYYAGNKKQDLVTAVKDFATTYVEYLDIEVYDWEGTVY